jgi:hypothetical protein
MSVQPKIGVKVGFASKTVTTYSHYTGRVIGQQTHRGHKAWISVPPHDDQPAEKFNCGDFHTTATGAKRCGLIIAKRLGKAIGLEVLS